MDEVLSWVLALKDAHRKLVLASVRRIASKHRVDRAVALRFIFEHRAEAPGLSFARGQRPAARVTPAQAA
jgi:hypothetical protein